ncbi:hypothetical protein P154DRAFT_120403 [Amniculicola lignicola CBS 123094]|uniref:Uncharacterized protein n=1 Tax=Amniculicola lignicola CBS 123094 TaxID=1392246 RepID=A0A6A5X3M8_9PLEO|nr:hypothetical protein P154DRAFT_120403 [Amniculicola lignicola CBS 123094]
MGLVWQLSSTPLASTLSLVYILHPTSYILHSSDIQPHPSLPQSLPYQTPNAILIVTTTTHWNRNSIQICHCTCSPRFYHSVSVFLQQRAERETDTLHLIYTWEARRKGGRIGGGVGRNGNERNEKGQLVSGCCAIYMHVSRMENAIGFLILLFIVRCIGFGQMGRGFFAVRLGWFEVWGPMGDLWLMLGFVSLRARIWGWDVGAEERMVVKGFS